MTGKLGPSLKIRRLLCDQPEIARELERFALPKGRGIDEVRRWLADRGLKVSRNGVYNYLCRIRDEQAAAAQQQRIVDKVMQIAREKNLSIADAAILQLSIASFEITQQLTGQPNLNPRVISRIALALDRLMLAAQRSEAVKLSIEQRERTALDEADKLINQGQSARSVVDRVREVLGLTTGDGK